MSPVCFAGKKSLIKGTMSRCSISAHGRHNGSTFILSCVRTVFSEVPLHGRWLPAEQLRLYMHQKCTIGSDITFSLASMLRVINKVLLLVSLEPNTMEIPGDWSTAPSFQKRLSKSPATLLLGDSNGIHE